MPFNPIPHLKQSTSSTARLPFEAITAKPTIPLPVPVTASALLVHERQATALYKAKRLQLRKNKAQAKRDRKRKASKKSRILKKSASAQPLEPVRHRNSVYDTKCSPISKAKRSPANHSYWNEIEHTLTIPSKVILQTTKREHNQGIERERILRQTQSQQDFARAIESIANSPSPQKSKPNKPETDPNAPPGMVRNKFGQYVPIQKKKKKKRQRVKLRPKTSPGNRPGTKYPLFRGMKPAVGRAPGPKYRDIDTLGSQSTLLRCSRPVSVSFSKTDRFDLLGSGDPNAFRGIGIPGPGLYKPIVPAAITGLKKHIKFKPVLTNHRFDGTNCTRVGNGFYYCSRDDMLRTKFPGPRYIVKDDYLSTNTASVSGGRFNMSNPASFVDVLTRRTSKLPGPSEYKIDKPDAYCRPSKDTVVPFGTKKSMSRLQRPDYQTAFDYDPNLVTPGPNQYNPKDPQEVTTDGRM